MPGIMSPASASPVIAQKAIEAGVRDFAGDDPARAQMALLHESEAFEAPRGANISRIDIRLETVEIEVPERIADERLQRLVHVARAPVRTAEAVTDLRAAACLVEVVERAVSDDGAVIGTLDRKGKARALR